MDVDHWHPPLQHPISPLPMVSGGEGVTQSPYLILNEDGGVVCSPFPQELNGAWEQSGNVCRLHAQHQVLNDVQVEPSTWSPGELFNSPGGGSPQHQPQPLKSVSSEEPAVEGTSLPAGAATEHPLFAIAGDILLMNFPSTFKLAAAYMLMLKTASILVVADAFGRTEALLQLAQQHEASWRRDRASLWQILQQHLSPSKLGSLHLKLSRYQGDIDRQFCAVAAWAHLLLAPESLGLDLLGWAVTVASGLEADRPSSCGSLPLEALRALCAAKGDVEQAVLQLKQAAAFGGRAGQVDPWNVNLKPKKLIPVAAAGHIKGLPIHTPQEVQQPMSPPAPSPDGNVLQEVPVPNLMGDFALAAEAGAQAGAPDAPDAAGDGQQAGAPDAPHAAGPSGPPRPVSAREALARQAVCSTFAASASFGAKRAMAAAHSFAAGVMPPAAAAAAGEGEGAAAAAGAAGADPPTSTAVPGMHGSALPTPRGSGKKSKAGSSSCKGQAAAGCLPGSAGRMVAAVAGGGGGGAKAAETTSTGLTKFASKNKKGSSTPSDVKDGGRPPADMNWSIAAGAAGPSSAAQLAEGPERGAAEGTQAEATPITTPQRRRGGRLPAADSSGGDGGVGAEAASAAAAAAGDDSPALPGSSTSKTATRQVTKAAWKEAFKAELLTLGPDLMQQATWRRQWRVLRRRRAAGTQPWLQPSMQSAAWGAQPALHCQA